MKTSLAHLSVQKQQELKTIVQTVKRIGKPEMIILFGSYARGDWVTDRYVENGTTFDYQSDFDILVVVRDQKRQHHFPVWAQLEAEITRNKSISTPVSLIRDNIVFFNEQLRKGRYFYADIEKEGIILYDSKKYVLTKPRVPLPQEQKEMAKEDFNLWMKKAEMSLRGYSNYFEEGKKDKDYLNKAAFELHQVTEALLICALLVVTGYKPKTHDLGKLYPQVIQIDKSFSSVFSRTTKQEERLFQLLRKAYVDARYQRSFAITQEDLGYLVTRIQLLRAQVTNVCLARIAAITS